MEFNKVNISKIGLVGESRFGKVLIKYPDSGDLIIHSPVCNVPFGLELKQTKTKTSYTLTLETDDSNFIEFLKELEDKLKGKLIGDYNFKSNIRESRKENFHLITNLKIPFRYRKFEIELIKDNHKVSIEELNRNNKVIAEIHFQQIWCLNKLVLT